MFLFALAVEMDAKGHLTFKGCLEWRLDGGDFDGRLKDGTLHVIRGLG